MSDDRNPSDAAALEQGAAVEASLEANRRTVEAKARDMLRDLSAIVAATDADVNANPAAHLRTLAKATRLLTRIALDNYEGTT